jgi:hypothetical protein
MATITSSGEQAERYLRLASTLCYVQGAISTLTAIALGVPAFAAGSPSAATVVVLLAFPIEAIGFGIAAWLLRKFLRRGALIALPIVALDIATRLFLRARLLNFSFAIDLGIVILIAVAWKRLESARAEITAPVD